MSQATIPVGGDPLVAPKKSLQDGSQIDAAYLFNKTNIPKSLYNPE
jgi:hypothetical protein